MRDFGDHDMFLQAIQDDMREVASLLQQLCKVFTFPLASHCATPGREHMTRQPSCMLAGTHGQAGCGKGQVTVTRGGQHMSREPPAAVGEERQRVAQLCLDVVKAVRAAAREARSLRRVWAELSRDLAALLCGMRPAVMLDYAILPGTALLAIVNSLRMHETGAAPLPRIPCLAVIVPEHAACAQGRTLWSLR
jgi:hypothetical protein